MRLIMAVSADGFVCTSPGDNMSWTGADDKAAFKMLTNVGGVLGVSDVTRRLMPEHLRGRAIYVLSRKSYSLANFQRALGEDVWIGGGQTLALAAVEANMIHEAFICHSSHGIGEGVKLDERLMVGQLVCSTKFGNTTIQTWRRSR